MAITYRFSNEAIAPASFLDSARAIQFIRFKAKEWNLDHRELPPRANRPGLGFPCGWAFTMISPIPKARPSAPAVHPFDLRGRLGMLRPPTIHGSLGSVRGPTPTKSLHAHLFGADLDKLDELPRRNTSCSRKVRPSLI